MADSKADAAQRARRSPTVPKQIELGKCKVCGEQVVLAMQKGVPYRMYADEEFCSAVCCREFHGTQSSLQASGRPKRSD
jgi:hypothetical protein